MMIVGSICFLLWTDPSNTLNYMIDASSSALELAIELCAVYAVWLGMLEIVEQSGLSNKLAKLLRPIIKKLFNVEDIETQSYSFKYECKHFRTWKCCYTNGNKCNEKT